jgi:hypothetical protein
LQVIKVIHSGSVLTLLMHFQGPSFSYLTEVLS